MVQFDKIEVGLNLASIKSNSIPLLNAGEGSSGTSETLSRSDHVHPESTDRLVVKSYPGDPVDPVLHEIFWNEAEQVLKICTAL